MDEDSDHSSNPNRCKCDHCSTSNSSASSLKRRIRQLHSGCVMKYSCNLCDATFRRKDGRDCHIVSVHTGEKRYKCKDCPSKFSSSGGLSAHQFFHTEERPNKCKICSKSFKRPGALTHHVKTVHYIKTREFQCSVCQKTFCRKPYLDEHSKTHDESAVKYSCYFCPKTFLRKGDRGKHLRIHTQEKSFTCNHTSCKYSTSDASSFSRHKKHHHSPDSVEVTPSRTWTCYFCSRTLNRLANLEVHLRTHTTELPFSCSLCSKSFTGNDYLLRHIRSHINERPFRCFHCQKCFFTNSNLRSHIAATHAKERRFFCEFCPFSAYGRHAVTKHQLCAHLPN